MKLISILLKLYSSSTRGQGKGHSKSRLSVYEKAVGVYLKSNQPYLTTQAGWTERNYIELSRAEEAVDRHWTATVVEAN
jgi:hypothetical protein|tara:strand:+ start:500 stop:736 length:237 start_codon:yes stop_codon:yes gene_type:complete